MKRLFHWGPLFALTIIKCISFTTLYYTDYWLDLFQSWTSFFNYLIYYSLLAAVLYNFLCAIFFGPGYVPEGWRPALAIDEQYLQYCQQCNAFKAPRSHHCSKCKRCILKMDHHCPWINNCCGYNNQRYFFLFLFNAVVGCLHSLILMIITLYRALTFTPNRNHFYIPITFQGLFLIILSIALSFGVIVGVGFLLFTQLKIIIKNRTSIEDWIVEKSNSRTRTDKFIYPYDLGIWKNIRQVLFEPLSNGLDWPVKDGCNQYTLTYEQILQKKYKIQNAILYRIIKDYNGRFFPLFSQGLLVCITFPINDDPRLAVKTDDEVLVTHSYKHWLYGQKMNTKEKIAIKGWFPKRCSVQLVKPKIKNVYDNYTNHNKNKCQTKKNK